MTMVVVVVAVATGSVVVVCPEDDTAAVVYIALPRSKQGLAAAVVALALVVEPGACGTNVRAVTTTS